jgi:hypothetical protein
LPEQGWTYSRKSCCLARQERVAGTRWRPFQELKRIKLYDKINLNLTIGVEKNDVIFLAYVVKNKTVRLFYSL